MHCLALGFAISGFITGLIAAGYWLAASKVEIVPIWNNTEPTDPILSQMGWMAGALAAASESARLNKIAAALTAITVFLTTVSSVLGLLPLTC